MRESKRNPGGEEAATESQETRDLSNATSTQRDDADAPASATRMWPATRRPFGPERRKDPAARHRHEQAETGVPPAEQVAQRRRQREAPPSNVVSFWSDDKDA